MAFASGGLRGVSHFEEAPFVNLKLKKVVMNMLYIILCSTI